MSLPDFVIASTERGECNCGKCADRGDKPDPVGHSVDNGFFVVAKRGEPSADTFVALTKAHHGEFNTVNPLDGAEHNYLELGGWLGDQGLALQYMALGSLLGVFTLMTPKTMLPGIDDEISRQMARMGMVAVQAHIPKPAEASAVTSRHEL